MSLVNQMLRDLEARREREQAAAPQVAVQAVSARRRSYWWPLAVAGVVIAVAAAAYIGSFVGKRVNHVESLASSAPASSFPSPSGRGARGEGSAVDKLASGSQVHDSGHPHRNPSPEGRRAETATPAEKPTSSSALATTNEPAPAPASVAAKPAASTTKSPATKPHPTVTDHPRMTKTAHPLTPAEKAAAAYAEGVKAAQAGDPEQAEAQFAAALNADPTAFGARQALAALLDRQGRTREAIQLFINGMREDPAHRERFARLYARLLVAHGRTDEAIGVLKENLPPAAEAPEHYAFLAALQERRGDHEAAVDNYTKALAIRPDAGRWWAGLGIACEQWRKPDKALVAYRRARRAGGLGVTLTAWVNKRIDALAL